MQSYKHCHIYNSIKSYYIHIHVHLCLLLLSMDLFVCHLLLRISLWSQWRYCVSSPVPVRYSFVYFSTIWPFTFLVELLQIILVYVTSFVVSVCLSFCLYLQKIPISHISHFNMITAVCHIRLILVRPRAPVTMTG